MFIRNFSIAIDDRHALTRLLRIADVVIVIATGAGAYWARHGVWTIPEEYLVAIALGALLAANYIHMARLYDFSEDQRFALKIAPLTASWLAVIVTMLLIAYFGKVTGSYSRVWGATWFVTAYLLLVAARGAFLVMLDKWRRNGDLSYNIVVVGAGEFGHALLQHLDHRGNRTARVVGLFDDRATRIPEIVAGHEVRGNIDDLLLFVRGNRVDQIVIALPWSAHERLNVILRQLATVSIDVKLCPSEAAFEVPNLGYGCVAGIPMLTILKPPLTGWNRILKNVEDRALGAAILLITGPLMLFIALGIKATGTGPVLFRQQRYGFNNNEFTLFKFRSMATDVPERNPGPASGLLVQARRDDPRVTAFGRFLRRTSLDELPQLFNVMRGEMALVGPRPHAVEHNEEYARIIDRYLVRHKVKPGITGWAQVNGLRGETSTPQAMRRRVQHDLQYIENWSLLLDLRILALTLFTGFMHDNAY